ncbi:glucose 1-dehydrogenase [Streptomyces sp. NPDC051684]|uniref:glucose 1-dehydrogenase n=1 Tax=Streptomyces sp. NPDC051684 TaxID=3365670 RepID=UPI00379EB92A
MTGRMDGKTVLISGGAGGLGAAHARRIVAEGGRAVIGDVQVEEGEALAAELGPRCAVFTELDVTREASWQAAVTRATETFGALNGLVNNAGIVHNAPIEKLTEADYRRVVDVDQLGVFLGMKTALAPLRAAGGGSIVNISSTAGIIAFPNILPYVAAKWAVRGMTKAAAQEFAPDGIRVNSVHPGLVTTPMTAESAPSHAALQRQPVPRMGRPEEMAAMVVFLLSDEATYATGAEFVIDGGYTAL